MIKKLLCSTLNEIAHIETCHGEPVPACPQQSGRESMTKKEAIERIMSKPSTSVELKLNTSAGGGQLSRSPVDINYFDFSKAKLRREGGCLSSDGGGVNSPRRMTEVDFEASRNKLISTKKGGLFSPPLKGAFHSIKLAWGMSEAQISGIELSINHSRQ